VVACMRRKAAMCFGAVGSSCVQGKRGPVSHCRRRSRAQLPQEHAKASYDKARSGVEWWVQVRHGGSQVNASRESKLWMMS
jgi:hypothetical protein